MFRALFPIMVEDLTRGAGRFNVEHGALANFQGSVASLLDASGTVIAAINLFINIYCTPLAEAVCPARTLAVKF